ncbi:MAG: YtxH domain-containing protein [Candidatus Margulisiibacteriota bacterium]|nr:YtxH domain-containing protein [Candidatus Margulisiibacteriota bacterium]
MSKSLRFMEGMVLGGLIGAALGLAFAPYAGEKTREVVKGKLREMDLDEIIDRFSEAFKKGKEEADVTLKEGKEQ